MQVMCGRDETFGIFAEEFEVEFGDVSLCIVITRKVLCSEFAPRQLERAPCELGSVIRVRSWTRTDVGMRSRGKAQRMRRVKV